MIIESESPGRTSALSVTVTVTESGSVPVPGPVQSLPTVCVEFEVTSESESTRRPITPTGIMIPDSVHSPWGELGRQLILAVFTESSNLSRSTGSLSAGRDAFARVRPWLGLGLSNCQLEGGLASG
jgi:hypothetical protein